MKVLFSLLSVILGAYGVLALLRFGEILLVGGQLMPLQLGIAVLL